MKNGLEAEVSVRLEFMVSRWKVRNISPPQISYQASLKKINKILDSAIKEAELNPEEGLAVARQCSRAVLEAMPDPAQNQSRANTLRQYDTMESCLALVRQPGQYLAQMQKQFGPRLNPSDYGGGDLFNTAIKSQRQRLYAEGQGFNTQDEKNFCRKRSELLAAVERAYNRLRDQALGRPSENSEGLTC